jgi:hypothetical protein
MQQLQQKKYFLEIDIWLAKTNFKEHIKSFCFIIKSQLQQKLETTTKNPN